MKVLYKRICFSSFNVSTHHCLMNMMQLIQTYHQRHPGRPGVGRRPSRHRRQSQLPHDTVTGFSYSIFIYITGDSNVASFSRLKFAMKLVPCMFMNYWLPCSPTRCRPWRRREKGRCAGRSEPRRRAPGMPSASPPHLAVSRPLPQALD